MTPPPVLIIFDLKNGLNNPLVYIIPFYRGTTRGSRGRGRGMTRRDLSSLVSYKGRPSDGDGWNKVKLLNASKHDKTEVLRALVNSFKELQPLSFHKQGMNYVFYVETRSQVGTFTLSLFYKYPLPLLAN